jgi:hypothetical protein
VFVIVSVVAGTDSVFAHDNVDQTGPSPSLDVAPLPATVFLQEGSAQPPAAAPGREARAASRPAPLLPLYISFSAIEALEIDSTLRALGHGAHEANPILRHAAESAATLTATKAAAFVGIVYLSEKLWKRNRRAAVATMIVLNASYGALVLHNYSVRRTR